MKVHPVVIDGQGGIIEECESLVECPHCTRPMPIEEFSDNWEHSTRGYIWKKCKGCKRSIGIMQQMNGDFVGFELWLRNL